MNLPGIEVSAPALTEKDREDVGEAVALGVEYIALSFVRKVSRSGEIAPSGSQTGHIVAKIEKDTALSDLCGFSRHPTPSWSLEAISGWSFRSRKYPLARSELSGRPISTGNP
jgi:pyruvate kinase